MPLTHVRMFRVRHYECDVQGLVQQANYLRYMQEAAFDASAAAGYDLARYEALGCFWLIRETDLRIERPLRYGDSVTVKTYVADFRRVRSRRAYEFHLAESGEPVARAHTDWVFLDRETERPAQIPEEMKTAFFPEGPPATPATRERFPDAPALSEGFRTWRRVEWRDLDPAGHVNNAVYVTFVEEAARQATAARGWPLSRMAAEGFVLTARQHHLEYRQPALLDDELEITTWLSALTEREGVRHVTLTRVSDGALLARARSTWGAIDLETGEPVPIAGALLADLRPNAAGPAL